MFLTVHATAGVAIGQMTSNIWLALITGFISHFILDIIPHGDQNLADGNKKTKTNTKNLNKSQLKYLRNIGLIDAIITLWLMNLLHFSGLALFSFPIMLGVIGGLLPDAINASYIFFKIKWLKRYNNIHSQLHFILGGFTVNFKIGLVIQSIFLLSFLYIIAWQ
jgi:hypothetical protein